MSEVSQQQMADAIRVLSMDAVQQANSGHPGMPMGMADIAQVLWTKHMRHNPSNPLWSNRDRFVLSNGHGSMLLYSLLYLSGYAVSLDDLKQFRQLHSKTPGHPERGYTPGVETTTGPLGQGLANAVGFALAEKMLAAEFNQAELEIIDHYTYCFAGDGCLMEGISHEVASLAGTWKLNKLIVFYDDNGISIDGDVEGWFSDDTPQRFASYGWNVIESVEGHDHAQIDHAIEAAKTADKPTLICCKTKIGKGSPNKEGTHHCHGAPLGHEDIQAYKKSIGWPADTFEIPADVTASWNAEVKGLQAEQQWSALFQRYQASFPELAKEFKRRIDGELPNNWSAIKDDLISRTQREAATQASRKSSFVALNEIKKTMPELIGGSADLAPSNLTIWQEAKAFSAEDPANQYLHFGVREFGMSAIANGVNAYSGFKCFVATFLMFMEYARNAVRMSALMKLPTVFVFTHDSIGLGEDGPTHQPIEQIANLRATPNLDTWRPCDQLETTVAWLCAAEQSEIPSALCLSRQNLPVVTQDITDLSVIERGGYLLRVGSDSPDLIILSAGSEVSLALKVCEQLERRFDIKVNVVSMPCMNRFDKQSSDYKAQVLPTSCRNRVAIEAGASQPWYKYVGIDGEVFAIDNFGESAPADALYDHFGLSTDKISDATVERFRFEDALASCE
jgi:transketolase